MNVVHATAQGQSTCAGTVQSSAMYRAVQTSRSTDAPTPVPVTTMEVQHPMMGPVTQPTIPTIAGGAVFRVKTVLEIAVGPQPTMSAASAADPGRYTVAGTALLCATHPLARHPPYTDVPTPVHATTMEAPQQMTEVATPRPTHMIAGAHASSPSIVSETAVALQPQTLAEYVAVEVLLHAGTGRPSAQGALAHPSRCMAVPTPVPATTTVVPPQMTEAATPRPTHMIVGAPA